MLATEYKVMLDCALDDMESVSMYKFIYSYGETPVT